MYAPIIQVELQYLIVPTAPEAAERAEHQKLSRALIAEAIRLDLTLIFAAAVKETIVSSKDQLEPLPVMVAQLEQGPILTLAQIAV